jgi:hypothetical protein
VGFIWWVQIKGKFLISRGYWLLNWEKFLQGKESV